MLKWMQDKMAERQARRAEAMRQKEERRAAEAARVEEERERRLAEERKERQTKKNVLAILESGRLPDLNFTVTGGQLPFKFQQSERLLWVFPSVGYLEQKTRRRIVGRSAGTSVRVMKGVSVRAGRSSGTPIEYDEVVDRGHGILALTTKHIYFNGSERSVRIPFSKIVSVVLISDAVEVTRDRASGLPEFFVIPKDELDYAHELMHAIPAAELTIKSEHVEQVANYHLLAHDDAFDDLEDSE